MFSILSTLIVFFVTFLFQVLLVRIFRRRHIHPFMSFAVYGIGLCVEVQLALFLKEIPYITILLYILLTILLITFNFVPLLGTQSPSSVIVSMLEVRHRSLTQLHNAFDEREFIYRRLEDLVAMGFVRKKRQKYSISRTGIVVSSIVSFFSFLIGANQ